jgi:hypothetical protein
VCLCKELDIFIKRDSKYPELVLLHPDKLCSPYSNPVVRECSSGLLVELTKPATAQANQDKSESEIEKNERESESEEIRRLVCLPYPKVYELGHANAEQICDWSGAKVFRIEITDNARVVSLYHYADEWRICSSESSDCSDRICRVRVKHASAEEPRREGGDDEEEEEDRYYLNFPSTTHYNPWNFFEEKLTKPRQAFAAFTTATSTGELLLFSSLPFVFFYLPLVNYETYLIATGQGPPHGDKNEDGAKEDLGEGMINKTFGDFFWDIWQERDYRFPEDTSLCYCFMTAVPAIQIFTHLTPPGTCVSHHQSFILVGNKPFKSINADGASRSRLGRTGVAERCARYEDAAPICSGGGASHRPCARLGDHLYVDPIDPAPRNTRGSAQRYSHLRMHIYS